MEQFQTLSPPRAVPEDLVEQTAAAVTALAERHSWRLVVLFGSAASGGPARDPDLAVLPAAAPGLLEQGAWQAALEGTLAPWPVDLLVLWNWTSPVTRFQVVRAGICLS